MADREGVERPRDKRYARRDERGRFTAHPVDVGGSLTRDRRQRAGNETRKAKATGAIVARARRLQGHRHQHLSRALVSPPVLGARPTAPDPIRLQGWYYVATGLWPILHLRSFLSVTGPKTDTWLVQTFGGLIVGVGAALLSGRPERSATVLAASSAGVLAAADLLFVAQRRIRPVYLADAAIELVLLAAVATRRQGPGHD